MVDGFHRGCGPISKRSTPFSYCVGIRVTCCPCSLMTHTFRFERAVRSALADGARTPDLGGKTTTTAAAEAVTRSLEREVNP